MEGRSIMPLRDHFQPPLDDEHSWESLHSQWPAMIVLALGRALPWCYVAAPYFPPRASPGAGTGVTTDVWTPPPATFTVHADLTDAQAYEVRVFDTRTARQLVAVVKIVSPADKRRGQGHAFVAKCAALLQDRVSVTVVDIVTTSDCNLYSVLLELLGSSDPSHREKQMPAVYTASCRTTNRGKRWVLEAWAHTLTLGQPLPTLPLWLADNVAVPLELEASYEETCRALRIG
jgi:hypothetical protein